MKLPSHDSSSRFRIYRRTALIEIDIISKGLEVYSEILVKMHNKGHRITEIPVHFRPRVLDVSKRVVLKFLVSHLIVILKFWQIRNASSGCDYDDRAFDSKIPLQRYWQRRRYEIVMGMVEKKTKILDIGSGSSKIIQGLPQATAVDVEMGKLRFVRNRGRAAVCGSVFALPFKDNSFDELIFSQVLEHIPNKIQCMLEVNRVLKSGGFLIIGTPDYSRHFWVWLETAYKVLLPYAYGHEHITFFSMNSLRKLIDRFGFDYIKYQYVMGAELVIKARKRFSSIHKK